MSKNKDKVERPLLSRCALHAHQLKFNHPTSNKTIEFKAPLPKDMKAVTNQLSKWGSR